MSEVYQLRKQVLGLLAPLSAAHALDPFIVKQYPKHSLFRLLWTTQSRLLEFVAGVTHTASELPFGPGEQITLTDRGIALPDTAVTTTQLYVLLQALEHVKDLEGDVAEIGSFRGATTLEIAQSTAKQVFAVDPFIGYGGSESDLSRFRSRAECSANIKHLRQTSGSAARNHPDRSLSFVFVDAIHDVSNCWYDLSVWSTKVRPGGLIAIHDVDDHPGARLAARRFIKRSEHSKVWGYCPNLLIVENTVD